MAETPSERPWLKFYEAGISPSLEYPHLPLFAFLTRSAERFGNRPAILFYGRVITFRELDDLTDRFAEGLRRLGVRPGDRLAVMLPNVPQCVIAFYGGLKAGATLVMFNPLYVGREIEHQLRDSESSAMIALDLFYPQIAPVLPRTSVKSLIIASVDEFLPPVKRLLFTVRSRIKGEHGDLPEKTLSFSTLLESSGDGVSQPSPDDPAVLQYTGGTTGVPKGAMLTHRNLVANALQAGTWVKMRPGEERVLAVLPFFHAYGLTTCMNASIAFGAAIILYPKRFTTGEVLGLIARERPTIFPGIQAIYVAINNFPSLKKYDLSSIRACISGAGPLHAEVAERFETITGGRIVEGYGLSEASPVTHVNPLSGVRKIGSVGLPVPDTDARVVDPESRRPLFAGEVGELAVRGPQVMKGYWKRSEETAAVLSDGWLYTGDMARMDEEGWFYIVDRKKDMIKTRGENVYPREVEEVLFRHPKVKEAVVVGLPDTFSGETIKAYVVLKEGQSASAEEILSFCQKDLTRFKIPREIEFRTELPKTIVGKVLRRLLIEEEMKRRAGAQP